MRGAEQELELARIEVIGLGGDPEDYKPGVAMWASYGFIALGVFLAVGLVQGGGSLVIVGLGLGLAVVGSGVALLMYVRGKQQRLGRAQADCRAKLAQLNAELNHLESTKS